MNDALPLKDIVDAAHFQMQFRRHQEEAGAAKADSDDEGSFKNEIQWQDFGRCLEEDESASRGGHGASIVANVRSEGHGDRN